MATRRDIVELRINALIKGLDEIKKITSELDKLGGESVETALEVQKLNEEFRALRDVENNIQRFSDLKEAQDRLSESTEELNAKLRKQREELDRREQNVKSTKDFFESLGKTIKDLARDEGKFADSVKSAKGAVDKLTSALKKNQKEGEKIEGDLAKAINAYKKTFNSIQAYQQLQAKGIELDSRQKRSLELNKIVLEQQAKEIDAIRNNFERFQTTQEELTRSYDKAVARYEEATAALRDHKKSIVEAKEAQQEYKKTLSDQNKELAQFRKEVKLTENALGALEKEQEVLNSRFDAVKETLNGLGVEFKDFDAAAKKSADALDEFQKRLDVFTDKADAARDKLRDPFAAFTQEARKAADATGVLTSEVEQLDDVAKVSLDEIINKVRQLGVSFDQASTEVRAVFRDLDREVNLGRTIQEFKRLKSELAKSNIEVKEAEEAYERLTDAFDKLDKKNATHYKQLQQARSATEALIDKNRQLRDEYNRVDSALRNLGISEDNLLAAQKRREANVRSLINTLKQLAAESAKDIGFSEAFRDAEVRAGAFTDQLKRLRETFKLTAKDFEKLSIDIGGVEGLIKIAQQYEQIAEQMDKLKKREAELEKQQKALNKAIETGEATTEEAANAMTALATELARVRARMGNVALLAARYEDRMAAAGVATNGFANAQTNLANALELIDSKLGQVDRRAERLQNSILGLSPATRQALNGLKKFGRGLESTIISPLRRFEGIFATLGIGVGIQEIGRLITELEGLTLGLEVAAGEFSDVNTEMEFLTDLSDKLGVSLLSTSKSWVTFLAAVRNTTVSTGAAREIFSSVTEALSRLGKTSDDVSGALKAIEQSFQKQIVQAEELRGQLGERLPGAVSLAAKALGVTVGEFLKLQQEGRVLADEIFPKFPELLKEAGLNSEESIDTIRAAVNRLGNEYQKFFAEVAQGRGGDFIKGTLDKLTDASKILLVGGGQAVGNFVDFVQTSFGTIGDIITSGLSESVEVIDSVGSRWGEFADRVRESDPFKDVVREAKNSLDTLRVIIKETTTDTQALDQAIKKLGTKSPFGLRGLSNDFREAQGAFITLTKAAAGFEENLRGKVLQGVTDYVKGSIDATDAAKDDIIERTTKKLLESFTDINTQADILGGRAAEEYFDNYISTALLTKEEIQRQFEELGASIFKKGVTEAQANEFYKTFSKRLDLIPEQGERIAKAFVQEAIFALDDAGVTAGNEFSDRFAETSKKVFKETAKDLTDQYEKDILLNAGPPVGILKTRLQGAFKEAVRRAGPGIGADMRAAILAEIAKSWNLPLRQFTEDFSKVLPLITDISEKTIEASAKSISKITKMSVDEARELVINSLKAATREAELQVALFSESVGIVLSKLATSGDVDSFRETLVKAFKDGKINADQLGAAFTALFPAARDTAAQLAQFDAVLGQIGTGGGAALQSLITQMQVITDNASELAQDKFVQIRDQLGKLDKQTLRDLLDQFNQLENKGVIQLADEAKILKDLLQDELDEVRFDKLSEQFRDAIGVLPDATEDALDQVDAAFADATIQQTARIAELRRVAESLSTGTEIAKFADLLDRLLTQQKISQEEYNKIILVTKARMAELNSSTETALTERARLFAENGQQIQSSLLDPIKLAISDFDDFVEENKKGLNESGTAYIGWATTTEGVYKRVESASQKALTVQREALLGIIESAIDAFPKLDKAGQQYLLTQIKTRAEAAGLRDILAKLPTTITNSNAALNTLKAILDESKERAETLRKTIGGITAAFDGSVDSVKDTNEQLEESRKKNEESRKAAKGTSNAQAENAENTKKAAEESGKLSENVKKGQGFASAMASTLADARNQMAGLSSEALSAFNRIATGAARVRGFFGQMNAETYEFGQALESTRGQINLLRQDAAGTRAVLSNLFASSSNGINQYLAAINSARNLTKAAFLEQKLNVDNLTTSLNELSEEGVGGRALRHMVEQAERAAKSSRLLGDEDLQPLRQAIQNATSLMQAFRAEVDALEKQIDQQTAQLEGRGQEFALEQEYQEQLNQISALQRRADAKTSTRLDRLKSQAQQNFEIQLDNLRKEQAEAKKTAAVNEDLNESRIPVIAPQGGARSATAPASQRSGSAIQGAGPQTLGVPGVVGLGAIPFGQQKQQLEELGQIKDQQQQKDIRHLQDVKKLEDDLHSKRIQNIEREATKASVTIGGLRERLFNTRDLDVNDEFIRSVDKGLARLSSIRSGTGGTIFSGKSS